MYCSSPISTSLLFLYLTRIYPSNLNPLNLNTCCSWAHRSVSSGAYLTFVHRHELDEYHLPGVLPNRFRLHWRKSLGLSHGTGGGAGPWPEKSTLQAHHFIMQSFPKHPRLFSGAIVGISAWMKIQFRELEPQGGWREVLNDRWRGKHISRPVWRANSKTKFKDKWKKVRRNGFLELD